MEIVSIPMCEISYPPGIKAMPIVFLFFCCQMAVTSSNDERGSTWSKEAESQLGANKPMIRLAVGNTHDASDLNLNDVSMP